MALLNFKKRDVVENGPVNPTVEAFLQGYSIEVMPRTAEKVEDFRPLLPEGTRVYIAHIEGTPIEDMVKTAKRIAAEGYPVMPHFPARIIKDAATLENWIAMYQGEAGVEQALLLAGGVANPHGRFRQFDAVAGNRSVRQGGIQAPALWPVIPKATRTLTRTARPETVDDALRWKQKFNETTDAEMALATQFAFDAKPIIAWADSLKESGIDLPIHIGIAGPAKLQTSDQVRHRVRCWPVSEGAAKACHGRLQAVVALTSRPML